MAGLNQKQQPESEYMANDSLYTQIIRDFEWQPAQSVELAAPETEAPAQTNDTMDSTQEWENSNPHHRFNPNGPFNFSPQVPKGTSNHPESVKRRRIVAKKAGLAAALFRLKESGRSRKRHRKDALRKKQEFMDASEARQKEMLAEADKTSERELAAKIAACTKAWNELSPEAQQAHMKRADDKTQDAVEAPPLPEAAAVQPAMGIQAEAVIFPRSPKLTRQVVARPINQQAHGSAFTPVALSTRSRRSMLCLPADITDVDPRLVEEATAKNLPFVPGPASRKTVAKRSTSEADLPEKIRPNNRSKTSSPKKRRVGPIEFEAVERASQLQAVEQSGNPYGLRSRMADITTAAPSTAAAGIAVTSASRAIARADGIPGDASLPLMRKRDAEPVESLRPRRFSRPHKIPKPVNEQAACAIMKVMELTDGQGGAAGMVIPPRPLEQVREQDLNAKSDRNVLQFMESDHYKRWEQSQKKQY